jgi:hypothetical protein
VKDRNLLRRLERLERLLDPLPSPREAYLRSLSDEELDRLLVEAAEREGVELGEWELERRSPRPVPVAASPVASRESLGAGAAPGPPGPPERSEEPPVAEEGLAPVELDGGPFDPDPPRPEMVAAPRHSGPQVVRGHAINLEAVEEQRPEPRPEIVRAPERPQLGPDVS